MSAIKFICDAPFCGKPIAESSRMVTVSVDRVELGRRSQQFLAKPDFFDSGDGEVNFHEECFYSGKNEIVDFLYPNGVPDRMPTKRLKIRRRARRRFRR